MVKGRQVLEMPCAGFELMESQMTDRPIVKKHLRYFLGDQVQVKALKEPANVISVMWDECGVSYKVVYWIEGTRKCEWLFEWELVG